MLALLPFASTYLCESGFSRYVQMKTKYRARLDAKSDISIQLSSRTFQNCCSPENKCIALSKTCLGSIFYVLWLLLLRIILFTVRNLNNRNLGEKSVDVYLAVLAGVPCPLKTTLQYSADKKVWEPLS